MIVYVESNFPLEPARQQEESAEVEQVLQLAEAGRLELVFPQLAVAEPFGAIDRYANERNRLLQELERQLAELNRSQPHQPLVTNMQPLIGTLARMRRDETDRLAEAVERMLRSGRSVPLSPAIFADARAAARRADLSPQDAIVFATVVSDLNANPGRGDACFASRNSKDFAPLKDELSELSCRYMARFADALAFIRSRI